MATCGTCKKSRMGEISCEAGHEIQLPTMLNEHDCKDYDYEPAGEIVAKTPFNVPEHEYCLDCAHELNGVCDGKKWIPYKTKPRCEFFREKILICIHAYPFIQYGNGLRNNRCKLKSDGQCCPWAHIENNLKCYKSGR